MKVGLISAGMATIGYDYKYEKVLTHALYNELIKEIENFGIEEGIYGGTIGPDVIWAWACEACGVKIHSLLSCVDFNLAFSADDKERASKIKKGSKTITTISEGPWTPQKERAKNNNMISTSDMMILIWDEKGEDNTTVKAEMQNYMVRAGALDKELLIINPKELV